MAGNSHDSGAGGGEAGPSTGRSRHLDRDGLDDYLNAGAPIGFKIEGDPIVHLLIDPQIPRLSLRTPAAPGAPHPDLSAYRNIKACIVHWANGYWSDVSVDGPVIRDAYPLLCAIADKVQIGKQDMRQAIGSMLDSLHVLLAHRTLLSEDEQTGLFGELIVFRRLVHSVSAKAAVAAWRGPDSEEHDFDIGDVDLEVKTTMSESRQHWISSLEQLKPTIGRTLWFASVQLTIAGAGGHSLPELIANIEASLPEPETLRAFRKKLDDAKWRADLGHLYPRRLRLRTKPAILRVDASFPALTPDLLATSDADQNRLLKVRYMIDVGGLEQVEPLPKTLTDIGAGAHDE